jgi:hypothetical protein
MLYNEGNSYCGRVAQLGERLVRNEEVRGSSPLTSTIIVIVPPASEFLCAVLPFDRFLGFRCLSWLGF